MFLCFEEGMPNLAKYIVIYGNNESVEVNDFTAKMAYNSVKNWLNGSKKIHGVYSEEKDAYGKHYLFIDETGEYVNFFF